tara:strand:+ start:208 stop:789 length:582 start_codon:yes stop_codon:yes gene_type:complete
MRQAVSIVLLPPIEIEGLAVMASQDIPNNPLALYTFARPHISLYMGCLDARNAGIVKLITHQIATETPPLELSIEGFYTISNSLFTGLKVRKTPELQTLHERIANEVSPYLFHDNVKPEMFCYGSVEDKVTLDWVRDFPEKKCFENYNPHITVGKGKNPSRISKAIPFTASNLTIAHLGNYCTVVKELEEFTL